MNAEESSHRSKIRMKSTSYLGITLHYYRNEYTNFHHRSEVLMNDDDIYFAQEGFSDPPSVSSISRLLRGGRPGDDGKKDYTIDGILGGGE